MKQCRLTQSILKYLQVYSVYRPSLERMANLSGLHVQSACLGPFPAGVCLWNANWSYFHLQITWFYRWFAPPHPIKFHLIPNIYKSLYSLQSTLTFFALGFSSHQYGCQNHFFFFQTKQWGFFFLQNLLHYQSHWGKKWINESLVILSLKRSASS